MRDFLHELEDSDMLAKEIFQAVSRTIKKNPGAEFVFNVVWGLHRYKMRTARARTSEKTAARLRAEGRKLGRPALTATDSRVQLVQKMRSDGVAYAEICERVGISKSTAHRFAGIRKPR
jgi:DNA invertase Pin-like site-specific DNA recombinase